MDEAVEQVRALRTGARGALEGLYREMRPRLYRFAYSYTMNGDMAEDFVQDARGGGHAPRRCRRAQLPVHLGEERLPELLQAPAGGGFPPLEVDGVAHFRRYAGVRGPG